MEYEYDETTPDVHADAAVCAEATLVGDVQIGPRASVWPGAVLRGDVNPITVGADSHVEDNTVVHGATIGNRVMVGHGAIVDGKATVHDGTLVGNNSTINHGVIVGERSIVASGAVIPDGVSIPPSSFVRGVPATVTPLEETNVASEEVLDFYSPDAYRSLIATHEQLFDGGSD